MHEWVSEWVIYCMGEKCVSKWMSELLSDCVTEYINEWKCLSLEVWMSECITEWVSKQAHKRISDCVFYLSKIFESS